MGIFIVVAVVLVALNLFFVFIIRSLGARIGNFAQSNMLRQSSVFDEVILRKEETLQGLLASIETAEGKLRELKSEDQEQKDWGVPTEFHSVTPGNYMDPDFAKDYKEIRENFIFDKDALVREAASTFKDEPEDSQMQAARDIIASLDSDVCYQLSSLSHTEQLAALGGVFNEDQNKLLRKYAEVRASFESYEFVAWLKEYIYKNGREIIVRTGMKSDNFNSIDSRIRTEYDDSLIEGLYVIHKGTLYDYSIRGKEISG